MVTKVKEKPKAVPLTVGDDIRKRMSEIIGEKSTFRIATNDAGVMAAWRYSLANVVFKIAEKESDAMKAVVIDAYKGDISSLMSGDKHTLIAHKQLTMLCEVRNGQSRFDPKLLVTELTAKGWSLDDINKLIEKCTKRGSPSVLLSHAFTAG